MQLDPNADVISMEELATDLLKRIEGWKLEQELYIKDSFQYHYINGLISAYGNVCMMIGADTDV